MLPIRPAAVVVLAGLVVPLAGCSSSGSGGDPTAAAGAGTAPASTPRVITIADPAGDVPLPAADITGGTVRRTGTTLDVTLRTMAAPTTAGPGVAYGAMIEDGRRAYLAMGQFSDGRWTFRLLPQDGSPGRDIPGTPSGASLSLSVPLDAMGTGPLRVSLMAQADDADATRDAAPDDGWPGPGRVDVG